MLTRHWLSGYGWRLTDGRNGLGCDSILGNQTGGSETESVPLWLQEKHLREEARRKVEEQKRTMMEVDRVRADEARKHAAASRDEEEKAREERLRQLREHSDSRGESKSERSHGGWELLGKVSKHLFSHPSGGKLASTQEHDAFFQASQQSDLRGGTQRDEDLEGRLCLEERVRKWNEESRTPRDGLEDSILQTQTQTQVYIEREGEVVNRTALEERKLQQQLVELQWKATKERRRQEQEDREKLRQEAARVPSVHAEEASEIQ